jgi:hypothetical protein
MPVSLSDTSDVTAASKPVVETVVNTVARVEGVDPVDLSEPVFAFVDPDALDALVSSTSGDSGLTISFEAWNHEITVTGTGDVRVDGETRDRVQLGGEASAGGQEYR